MQLNLEKAMATIWDDDAPELSITAGPAVTDGAGLNAIFNVTSQVQPSSSTVIVDYTPVSANFLASSVTNVKVPSAPLTFTGDGPYTAPLAIPVVDQDTANNSTGSIMVTLNEKDSNANYYVGTPDNAMVTVYDDDGLPRIVIKAEGYTDVVETAGTATFELSATGLETTTKLMVKLYGY